MSAVSTVRTTVANLDRGTRRISALGGTAVLLTLLTFLVAPSLTLYPLVGFVAVVAYGWYTYQAETAKFLTFLTTVSTTLILGLITLYLLVKAVPALQVMGLGLLTHVGPTMWRPSADVFSLVPMMWGTVLTTFIAMAVAAPLGVAGAVFISEMAPAWARELIKPAVETLAGIPSIVYGFIGYVVINQYMMTEFSLPTYGSLFVVGLVVGVMALPTVVSVAEDAIDAVPGPMKDGALALGATSWQTTTSVTLPASFSGVSAAILLGVGRAVGETMAATVILAHMQTLPEPLYDVFGTDGQETLTSLIASQYGVASGTHLSALFAAGVVLFVTVLALSIGSQLVEAHMQQKLGGEV